MHFLKKLYIHQTPPTLVNTLTRGDVFAGVKTTSPIVTRLDV